MRCTFKIGDDSYEGFWVKLVNNSCAIVEDLQGKIYTVNTRFITFHNLEE